MQEYLPIFSSEIPKDGVKETMCQEADSRAMENNGLGAILREQN